MFPAETEMTEQPGQKSLVNSPKVDSKKKKESFTKEKILEATLKHKARMCETPIGHLSELE